MSKRMDFAVIFHVLLLINRKLKYTKIFKKNEEKGNYKIFNFLSYVREAKF